MRAIANTETKHGLGTQPGTLRSIPRILFTVLFLLFTVVLFTSPGLATRHEPWDKLAGFEPTPDTLVQLGEGYAMGLERNPDTGEFAAVIYTMHDFDGCQRQPCLLFVIAFAVYNQDGELVAFHQEPESGPFENLLKLPPLSGRFVSL